MHFDQVSFALNYRFKDSDIRADAMKGLVLKII